MANKNMIGSKNLPITLDEEGSITDQAHKEVKKEEEEETPLPTVSELQDKVTELERKNKKLIKIGGEYLQRAENLEIVVEKKTEILKEANKEKEELEKKVKELEEEKKRWSNELDEERRKTNEKNRLLVEAEKDKEELEIKVIDRTNELIELAKEVEEERRNAEEDRKRHIELTKEMEEERRKAEEERKRFLDESEKQKEESRRRLREMAKQINEVIGSVPMLADSMDGNEERMVLRVEDGQEPMEMMEMVELEGDSLDDHNMEIGVMIGIEEDIVDLSSTLHEPHSDEQEVEKRRRSSRNVNRSLKYADSMEESNEEDEPSEKKRRSKSLEKKEKVLTQKKKSSSEGTMHLRTMKMNIEVSYGYENDEKKLKCPECEYQFKSASGWVKHLKFKHSTTPFLVSLQVGCLLRCDCGNESYSYTHSQECDISNFTIIPQVVTPQCILCEMHPKTAYGYAYHLIRHHKTTLKANGIYLTCSCGTRYNSHKYIMEHDKECPGNNFTLHKIDED